MSLIWPLSTVQEQEWGFKAGGSAGRLQWENGGSLICRGSTTLSCACLGPLLPQPPPLWSAMQKKKSTFCLFTKWSMQIRFYVIVTLTFGSLPLASTHQNAKAEAGLQQKIMRRLFKSLFNTFNTKMQSNRPTNPGQTENMASKRNCNVNHNIPTWRVHLILKKTVYARREFN